MPGFSTKNVEVLELFVRFSKGEQGKYDQLFLRSKRSENENDFYKDFTEKIF